MCSHLAYDNMCTYVIVSVPVTLACAMFLFVLSYELISPTLSYTAYTHITVQLYRFYMQRQQSRTRVILTQVRPGFDLISVHMRKILFGILRNIQDGCHRRSCRSVSLMVSFKIDSS